MSEDEREIIKRWGMRVRKKEKEEGEYEKRETWKEKDGMGGGWKARKMDREWRNRWEKKDGNKKVKDRKKKKEERELIKGKKKRENEK